jgi:hypothetical protein
MTSSSPSPETVRFIATIIAARRTPLAEVPELIRHLDTVLTGLVHARTERPELPGLASAVRPESSATRTKLRAPPRPAPATAGPTRMPPVDDTIAAQPVPVRRGRKPGKASAPQRRASAEVGGVEDRRNIAQAADEPSVVEPAAPRLLRKADVAAQHYFQSSEPEILVGSKPPSDLLHGVVKWFDARTHRGALRLTGVSGDVPLEGAALDRSGIKRIYKDQEIAAKVLQSGGRVQVISIELPGRPAEPERGAAGAETAFGTIRRQPKQVVVEVKRNGGRHTSARAEAEHVLGGVGRSKTTRRVTS